MEILNNIVILILLALCTFFDIKSKQLPLKMIALFALIIVERCFANGYFGSWDFLLRLAPGVLLLLIAFATNQAIGYGDGVIIVLIGLMLDIQVTISLIFIAFILSSIISLIILISKKGDRQTRLPFMPFMLTAWCICLM